MSMTTHRYVTDDSGKRIGVIISVEEYAQLLAALEELESIQAYDAAKAAEHEVVPFEQAVEEIERNRP